MKNRSPGIDNRIKTFRLRMGWTQETLAQKIGLRRQAVYDMESGRYLPNTEIALRLAGLFGCTVEALFALRETSEQPHVRLAEELFPSVRLKPGARLALARIGGELVGVPLEGFPFSGSGLPPADAILRENGGVAFTTPPGLLDQNVFIFGCNPALDILDAHIRRQASSARIRRFFVSSGASLAALAGGATHVAATHFHSETGDANIDAIKRALPDEPCVVVAFSAAEEGLMLAQGNPLGVRTLEDLADPRLRLVNREPGAALRRLLDAGLAAKGIPAHALNGYDDVVRSHAEGAYRVRHGAADAALGMRITADAFGLAFLPLAFTRCDLVIPEKHVVAPAMDALLNALCSSRLRRELEGFAGYDASVAGREITRTSAAAES